MVFFYLIDTFATPLTRVAATARDPLSRQGQWRAVGGEGARQRIRQNEVSDCRTGELISLHRGLQRGQGPRTGLSSQVVSEAQADNFAWELLQGITQGKLNGCE
jgi:hypothetical protein